MFTYRDLDLIFSALAEPTRRFVFERLCVEEEESVSALTEPLPLSRQAGLHHLGVLEKSGLIRTEKRDRVRWCRVEPRVLDLLEQWLHQYRGYFEQRHAHGRSLPRAVDQDVAELLRSFSSLK